MVIPMKNKRLKTCELKGWERMNWSKAWRSWRLQKFIKICTEGDREAKSILGQRQEAGEEEHDEKCLVLHLSGGGGGGQRDGSMSPEICNRKICHQKYSCHGILPGDGGRGVFIFFLFCFPLSKLQINRTIVVTDPEKKFCFDQNQLYS